MAAQALDFKFMSPTLCLAALVAVAPPVSLAPPDPRHTLMPVPASLAWREGKLRIGAGLVVIPISYADDRLRRGMSRTMVRLERQTGLRLLASIPTSRKDHPTVRVRVHGPGESVQSPAEVESYSLEVDSSGAEIEAETVVGALRGLETLLQLVEADSAGWFFPAVRIEDTPRFSWRGLLIDVGRHWEPPEVIKRQLDGMAAVKLNVLHWHLSEDQGFRVESRRYPLLHGLGSDGRYYTQSQIREIVAYARDRGIRVVPEFDMPGHSTAWFVGYPEFASAPGPYRIERLFGVFDPAFDPTRERTYRFLDGFIGEMAALFPDRYWHIGGDEVAPQQWRSNRLIRAFMHAKRLADNAALQAHFNRRMADILTRHGKRMAGWDEILHPDLPSTTVIQSWRGQESLGEGAKKGYTGILSAGWYLDHMRTAEYHYLVDPLPEGTTLTAEESGRVLGGEACMWGEHVTPASIDSRIWPRLGAIAERLWSPREVRDVPDMYRRLAALRGRLQALGLDSEGHTARMVEGLAGTTGASALVRLLNLTEPVSFGERVSRQKLTQLTPLTFVVDAARPDPPSHWNTRALVVAALNGDLGALRELREAFTAWPSFAPAIDSLTASAPLVKDAMPAAAALVRLGAIGLEALDHLERGSAPPEWVVTRSSELDSLAKPQGLLRVSIIPALRALVQGVGSR